MFKKKDKKQEEKTAFRKDYNTVSNMLYIFKNMFKEQKMLIPLIIIGTVFAPFTQYLWTVMSKLVVDLITEGAGFDRLLFLIIVGGLVQLISSCLSNFSDNTSWWRFVNVRVKMKTQLNAKAMSVNFEYLEDKDVLDIFQKASQAAGNNDNGIEGMMRQSVNFLKNIMIIGTGIIIMGTLSPWIILMLFIFAFIQFLVVNHIKKKDKKMVWDELMPWWRKNNYMSEVTTGFDYAKEVRLFNLSGWLTEKMRVLYAYRYKKHKESQKNWLISGIADTLISAGQFAFVYVWIIFGVTNNQINIADAVLYIGTSGTFFKYLTNFFIQLADIKGISREVNDFRTFLEYPVKGQEKTLSLPNYIGYSFTFENVSFKYPKAESYALKNVNITLNAGERLAVVGLNGAGKSTFIKLLLRLYEPTDGRILLNGQDITDYDLDEYYKIFSPVFQEVELFAFPMSQNVSLQSVPETDVQRAEECLRLAGLEDKLDELEKGVNSEILKIIYDDGIDLSGGEKQKLALARALYKNAPTVVLDEPTSALDALAEYKLYQDFDKLIGEKTAVYISHRLSSTRFCDNVAMFKDGEIIETGTHESLLQENGEYAEMFRVQAQYYVESNVKEEALQNA